MMSHWKDTAERVIRKAMAEAKEQGLDFEATTKLVDSRYPFGERAYHPYKMWLKVRRDLLRPKMGPHAAPGTSRELLLLAAWNAGEPIKGSE